MSINYSWPIILLALGLALNVQHDIITAMHVLAILHLYCRVYRLWWLHVFVITCLGANISMTIELRVFFSEKVNDFSRIVLNFEVDLQQ